MALCWCCEKQGTKVAKAARVAKAAQVVGVVRVVDQLGEVDKPAASPAARLARALPAPRSHIAVPGVGSKQCQEEVVVVEEACAAAEEAELGNLGPTATRRGTRTKETTVE